MKEKYEMVELEIVLFGTVGTADPIVDSNTGGSQD